MTDGPFRKSSRKLDAGGHRRLLFEKIWSDSIVAVHNTLRSRGGAI